MIDSTEAVYTKGLASWLFLRFERVLARGVGPVAQTAAHD